MKQKEEKNVNILNVSKLLSEKNNIRKLWKTATGIP
jgi:hypothetical protein